MWRQVWVRWRWMILGTITGLAQQAPASQQQIQSLLQEGHYREAFTRAEAFILNTSSEPNHVPEVLNLGIRCLTQLNRYRDADAFLESAVEVHGGHWRVLAASARAYLGLPHHGFIIAGEFERGPHRGGGRAANCSERDRTRALQLYARAMPLVAGEADAVKARFYMDFAQAIQALRSQHESWRLQYLTDLTALPDVESGYFHRSHGNPRGAPVLQDGSPVFYGVPERFEKALNDGERWRWLLARSAELQTGYRDQATFTLASFLWEQFGVQTMLNRDVYGRHPREDAADREANLFGLQDLPEYATVARLAGGIRRLELPASFQYIAMFRELAENASAYRQSALQKLAEIFQNRQQFDKAAAMWRQLVEQYPQQETYREQLDRIVKPWGRFENGRSQPAGQKAAIRFRFRNGRRIHFEAREIKLVRLLADVKAYLRANPADIDWERIDLNRIGRRLVFKEEKRYQGRQVAKWQLLVKPRDRHFDRVLSVDTPLTQAGAYLLSARFEDGNVSRTIVWIEDTLIVRKRLDGEHLVYVADARTGTPMPLAQLEFFGFRTEAANKLEKLLGRRRNILTKKFEAQSDENGLLRLSRKRLSPHWDWLIVARGSNNRMAFHGWSNVHYGDWLYQANTVTKTYTITDRPVYCPNQTVKFKIWLAQTRYDEENLSRVDPRSVLVEIFDPHGDKQWERHFQTDEFGGLDGEFVLPVDAGLGQWSIRCNRRLTTFRVEEYKKPEFEVLVEAPSEPIMLGDAFQATIRARYYYGAPVTRARATYKVLRYSHNADWYPPSPWDWLYGAGHGWLGYDYTWLTNWKRWGCGRPAPWWRPRENPPELVAEHQVVLDELGAAKIHIDTLPAKLLHGDNDHRYAISVEVTDLSRRTIVGGGEVLVARRPFRVYAWVDRGHYQSGDVIRANFAARTLDRKPVAGKGEVTLYRLSYGPDRHARERTVQTWRLGTDTEGKAGLQLKADRPGQYRLSYTLTNSAGNREEGGYVFSVYDDRVTGGDFRYGHLELVPDKSIYQPGEIVRLRVNTDRPASTVLLFLRPVNGVYQPPKVLQLEGPSTVHEIEVTRADMPNFFVEAVTVGDARLFTETREIIVPPGKRILDVEVLPSAASYQPGEHAGVKLRLTDFNGKPFHGQLALTIYDKAVEYIAGGSNVPDIKTFFWKWRRGHRPKTSGNFERRFANLLSPNERGMNPIGVFGDRVALLGFQDDALGSSRSRDRAELRKSKAGSRALNQEARMDLAAPMELGESLLGSDEASPEFVTPTVRTRFADTAYWNANLQTNANGEAEISLDMPENLTTWKIRVWGMGQGTRVGEGMAEVTTSKDLIVRLQAPRFFVEKDEVVLSANVHNYLNRATRAEVVLDWEGESLALFKDEPRSHSVLLDAGGETRVDWRVKVLREGEVAIRVKALTEIESDAVEMRFPVKVHGMPKQVAFSGHLRPGETTLAFDLTVPQARRIDQTRLELRYSPTLAMAMVDALPYLVSYPYGCTEQTLSRFLPTVITQKILLDMGLDLADIRDKRANLNAQELGDDEERAQAWKHQAPHALGYDPDGHSIWTDNPVFDPELVADMVKEGVARLAFMQLGNGGWGWFSGSRERAYPHTTAHVVHGLTLASRNGVDLDARVLERGLNWLKRYQNEQTRLLQNAEKQMRPRKNRADHLDALVYMVLVENGIVNDRMRSFLYRDRTSLSIYALAMFGLALHQQNRAAERDVVLRNIEQFLVMDPENQTAYLDLPNGGYWWYWYGSEFEAHAYYLKLLAATDPRGDKAAWLVKYLLKNRKNATYWKSTRDTAVCIEAFATYLRAAGEDRPDMTVAVYLDGRKHKEVTITAENLFSFDNKFVLRGKALTSGTHRLELRRTGTGPLYANAYLGYFSLEDPIPAAGLEIKVSRRYYRLVKMDKTVYASGGYGQALQQPVEQYRRERLQAGASLKSGDLVEVELVIHSKNDYEYLVFEDYKPAGFEAVALRSGYNGNGLGAYMELRDDRVAFFTRRLARGRHSLSYRVKAEIPGKFSALPARGYAMYAPEIKANADESKFHISD